MSSVFWHKRFSQQAEWTEDTREYLINRARVSSNSKILEVGSGTGAVLSTLNNLNPFGIDINYHHINYANKINLSGKNIQSDALNCPFPDNSFDIVYFHYFLLWIKDPIPILIELLRVLKKDGYIISFAEPDYSGMIIYPESLKEISDLQIKSLEDQGADPFIGKKLLSYFTSLNVTISEFGVINGKWNFPVNQSDSDLEWKVIEKDLHNYALPEDLMYYRNLEDEAINDGSFVRYVPTFYLLAKKK